MALSAVPGAAGTDVTLVVYGKGRVRDFGEIAASDLDYIRNWSLWRDVRVLLTTVSYILSGKNY